MTRKGTSTQLVTDALDVRSALEPQTSWCQVGEPWVPEPQVIGASVLDGRMDPLDALRQQPVVHRTVVGEGAEARDAAH